MRVESSGPRRGGFDRRGKSLDPRDMIYKKRESFSIQVDTHVLQSRQNQYTINNYYSARIDKHIITPKKLAPILVADTSITDSISPIKEGRRTKIVA